MTSIVFDGVTKEFVPGGARAVNEVSLEVAEGEFCVLVGPSGCGKTTLLRMTAGLEHPTSGRIVIDGRDVTDLQARDRDIAMVFQNYAIYPHMTVRANMGYGLKVRGVARREANERVAEVARLLGLDALLDRRPATLSGGQLQRVAIGRAIARQPTVYLMDEPLSNLDAKLRVSMRAELGALHRRLGVTTLYVTHDQVEAMTLGERAAVLRDGLLQQFDTPQRLFDQPANAFVARFIGSPPMNFAVGTFNGGVLSYAGVDLLIPDRFRPPVRDGERVLVGLRPDDIHEQRFAQGDYTSVNVNVTVREDLGAESLLFFVVPSAPGDEEDFRRATFEQSAIENGIDHFAFHCARVTARFPGAPGDTVSLTVAPDALHYFDINSAERLIPARAETVRTRTMCSAGRDEPRASAATPRKIDSDVGMTPLGEQGPHAMDHRNIDQAASQLRHAQESRTPCPPVRELLPGAGVVEAYAVQEVNTRLSLSNGRRLVGWKIGLTSTAVQEQLGVDQPDFGPLFADLAALDDQPIDPDQLLQPKVEGEIAFVLARDLTQLPVTAGDVVAATDHVVPAIEVVASRIACWDITIVDTIADNASSGMFVLGTTPTRLADVDLPSVKMTLTCNGTEVSSGTGAACLGDPLTAVVWLANTVANGGRPLRAGDVVLSGALGPMVTVEPGATYEASFDPLGTVRARFASQDGS